MSTGHSKSTTTNDPSMSPVEYVRSLSPEDKGRVLIALLRELIELNNGGKCLIPIQAPNGESLGYYTPPAAARAAAEASARDQS